MQRFMRVGMRMGIWIGLMVVLPAASGCAPSAQEWSELDALPPGPAREARRAALEQRQQSEAAWWDFVGVAASLAGGFLPGAGLAVAALRSAREAGRQRDRHAAAAETLTSNLGQALRQLPVNLRAQTLERIKQEQAAAGQRETIRAYLRQQRGRSLPGMAPMQQEAQA